VRRARRRRAGSGSPWRDSRCKERRASGADTARSPGCGAIRVTQFEEACGRHRAVPIPVNPGTDSVARLSRCAPPIARYPGERTPASRCVRTSPTSDRRICWPHDARPARTECRTAGSCGHSSGTLRQRRYRNTGPMAGRKDRFGLHDRLLRGQEDSGSPSQAWVGATQVWSRGRCDRDRRGVPQSTLR
jgi:hypothetical protein